MTNSKANVRKQRKKVNKRKNERKLAIKKALEELEYKEALKPFEILAGDLVKALELNKHHKCLHGAHEAEECKCISGPNQLFFDCGICNQGA